MLPNSIDVFAQKDAKRLYDAVQLQLASLFKHYPARESFYDFKSRACWHESVGMKVLACRTLLAINCDNFIRSIASAVSHATAKPIDTLHPHPIFYLRISDPSYTNPNTTRTAFFDSQPHFDRSFGVRAFSVWVALSKIDKHSGGLCFFSESSEISNLYPSDLLRNPYDYALYLENSAKLDKILVPHVIHPELSAGQAYLFGWYHLHAATKPSHSERVSFDFRVTDDAERLNHPVFEVFSISPLFSLLLTLHFYGDTKLMDSIRSSSLDLSPFEDVFSRTPDALSAGRLYDKLRWREEYAWLSEDIVELFRKNRDSLLGSHRAQSKRVSEFLLSAQS